MPADIQEYYKKILQFSNEMAEANDKIEELKSTYWDFIGMVKYSLLSTISDPLYDECSSPTFRLKS